MSNRIGTLTSTYPGKRFGSLCYFIKKKLQHRCFLVKFTKIFTNIFFYRRVPVAASDLEIGKSKRQF